MEVCEQCGGPNCSTSTTVITTAKYESIDRCSHCDRTWHLSPCEDCNVLTCEACWEIVGCTECSTTE